ncbi:hypothetical protein Leryth_018034 [Lithospermum erythrorhizon]|nr:hypothetical protein Leryth_018034 [Lithospermum erythrorhizon]
MAIFKSIKTLISKSQKNHKTLKKFPNSFFNLSSKSQLFYPNRYSSLLSPSKLFPINNYLIIGPLFLSSTPYKLSQSATPLHLQSDEVLSFLKIQAINLLHKSSNLSQNNCLVSLVGNEKSNKFDDSVDKCNDIGERVEIRDNYVNLPNFISLSRLLSGPLLGWMITQEMYSLAFIGLGISGATDWLDGYVARKMGINSVVGSYLDPLADKVLIGCVALSMVENGLLHPGLVALVVLRDVALVGGAVYKRASSLGWEFKSWSDFFNLDGTRPEKVEPLFLSKVNTVFQLILVAAALLQPEFGSEASQSYITYLSWLVAFTTISSTVAYGAQHLSRSSSITKIHK